MDIAIVTGASSGLGGRFVELLDGQERLDEIWVIARRRERLEALGARVRTPLRVLPLDLTDRAAVRELDGLLGELRPSVRVLINAAGFGRIGAWDDVTLADCESMIDLNCRAAVAVTRVALKHMGEGARIMQICSTAAFQPFPYLSVYARGAEAAPHKGHGGVPLLDKGYRVHSCGAAHAGQLLHTALPAGLARGQRGAPGAGRFAAGPGRVDARPGMHAAPHSGQGAACGGHNGGVGAAAQAVRAVAARAQERYA